MEDLEKDSYKLLNYSNLYMSYSFLVLRIRKTEIKWIMINEEVNISGNIDEHINLLLFIPVDYTYPITYYIQS